MRMVANRMNKKAKSLVVGSVLMGLYTLAGSVAFALLSPQSSITPFTFQTALMEIRLGASADGPFSNEFSWSASELLFPDDTAHTQEFFVENASSTGLAFQLTGQLQAGDQDWEALKDVIQVKISNTESETEWYTLGEWAETPRNFPGILAGSTVQRHEFLYRLMSVYPSDPDGDGPLSAGEPLGEELEGKMTSQLNFVISGSLQEAGE